MQAVLNATDVRKDWGQFIDGVVRNRPQFVKRNRDFFAALSVDQLAAVLEAYRFTLSYSQEQDGSFSGSLGEIDLVANAPTLSELKGSLAHELVEYANEYMNEYTLYANAPNRKQHLPYVLRVLIQTSEADVARLIDA